MSDCLTNQDSDVDGHFAQLQDGSNRRLASREQQNPVRVAVTVSSITSRQKDSRCDRNAVRPEQYSQGGYVASFGKYEIDESTHTFTYHVEGALVRSLIGKDLPRAFEYSGKQLVVKSTHPDEHWKAASEHY